MNTTAGRISAFAARGDFNFIVHYGDMVLSIVGNSPLISTRDTTCAHSRGKQVINSWIMLSLSPAQCLTWSPSVLFTRNNLFNINYALGNHEPLSTYHSHLFDKNYTFIPRSMPYFINWFTGQRQISMYATKSYYLTFRSCSLWR